MGRLVEWLEQKSHNLMTICIIIQGILFGTFTVIYFLEKGVDGTNPEDQEFNLRFKIYMVSTLMIFFGFMVHFAYHSVYLFLIPSRLNVLIL